MDRWEKYICIYIYGFIPILFFSRTAALLTPQCDTLTWTTQLQLLLSENSAYLLYTYVCTCTNSNKHMYVHKHTLTQTRIHIRTLNQRNICCFAAQKCQKSQYFIYINFVYGRALPFLILCCFFRNNVNDDGKSVKPTRQFSLSYCFLIIFFRLVISTSAGRNRVALSRCG